ncbi:MAG: class I SAM-dependent methyltransferase [Desulfurococcales archaeon]|nr:class I SAM-dependent methyltransferase [Desulfurococcales archaeon]
MEGFNPDGIDRELRWIALAFGGVSVPFVPTRDETLELVFEALRLGEGDVFYDLGCGNGKVVVEAARRFPIEKAVCVEARRELIEEARERATNAGVADKVEFIHGDMFKVDISRATAVYMYLLTSVNEALKPKLEKELRPGARVVTLDFQIPGWRPVRVVGERAGWQKTVYVYVIGESNRR